MTNFSPTLALELIHLLDRTCQYYDVHNRLQENKSTVSYETVENDADVSSFVVKNMLISSQSYRQAGDCKGHLPNANSLPMTDRANYEILHRFTVKQDFIKSWVIREDETFFGFILRGTKHESNKIYIVFRGTNEKTEWLQNYKIRQCYFQKEDAKEDVKVCEGFYDVYGTEHDTSISKRTSISKQLKEELAKIDLNKIDSVIITGHSLGGAIASFAAIEVLNIFKGSIIPVLYTFASPRAGNKGFAQKFDKLTQCFRIFNTEDIVPTMPPSTLFKDGEEMNAHNYNNDSKPERSNKKLLKNSTSITPSSPTNIFDEVIKNIKKIGEAPREASMGVRTFLNLSANLIDLQRKGGRYQHIGTPIAFTAGMDHISTNHNLYGTYRTAILKMIELNVYPELVISNDSGNREIKTLVLR